MQLQPMRKKLISDSEVVWSNTKAGERSGAEEKERGVGSSSSGADASRKDTTSTSVLSQTLQCLQLRVVPSDWANSYLNHSQVIGHPTTAEGRERIRAASKKVLLSLRLAMERAVECVRSMAETIFCLITKFVVGLILFLARGVSWATGGDGQRSGVYCHRQVEDIVAMREAELSSKFEGMWKEREMEKEQEVEEAKASCRAKAKELKKLKTEITEGKEEKVRLMDLVKSTEKSREEAVQESGKVKARAAKELYSVSLAEAEKYLAFLKFMSTELLQDSDVLSELITEQKIFVDRIRKDPYHTRECEPTKLFNVHCPNQPDYDNLRMDIRKKLAKISNSHLLSGSNYQLASAGAIPDVLRRLIGQVQAAIPDLSDVEVYEKILCIKAKNRGSLQGLTVRKVVDLISADVNADSDDSSTASADSLGQCAICIEPMYGTGSGPAGMDSRLQTLDGCHHTFHEDCIKQWLAKKHECPCCRKYALPELEYPPLSTKKLLF